MFVHFTLSPRQCWVKVLSWTSVISHDGWRSSPDIKSESSWKKFVNWSKAYEKLLSLFYSFPPPYTHTLKFSSFCTKNDNSGEKFMYKMNNPLYLSKFEDCAVWWHSEVYNLWRPHGLHKFSTWRKTTVICVLASFR